MCSEIKRVEYMWDVDRIWAKTKGELMRMWLGRSVMNLELQARAVTYSQECSKQKYGGLARVSIEQNCCLHFSQVEHTEVNLAIEQPILLLQLY